MAMGERFEEDFAAANPEAKTIKPSYGTNPKGCGRIG
jgi:hypothetical protein